MATAFSTHWILTSSMGSAFPTLWWVPLPGIASATPKSKANQSSFQI